MRCNSLFSPHSPHPKCLIPLSCSVIVVVGCCVCFVSKICTNPCLSSRSIVALIVTLVIALIVVAARLSPSERCRSSSRLLCSLCLSSPLIITLFVAPIVALVYRPSRSNRSSTLLLPLVCCACRRRMLHHRWSLRLLHSSRLSLPLVIALVHCSCHRARSSQLIVVIVGHPRCCQSFIALVAVRCCVATGHRITSPPDNASQ